MPDSPKNKEDQENIEIIPTTVRFERGLWEELHAQARRDRISFTALMREAAAHYLRYRKRIDQ